VRVENGNRVGGRNAAPIREIVVEDQVYIVDQLPVIERL